MDNSFYLNTLYPLQNEVLQVISKLETGFYLTGGTAVSRGYLQHRFSDDLDFFVNDEPRFTRWSSRIVQAISQVENWDVDILTQDDFFLRLALSALDIHLNVEMVNDVPMHVGEIINHPNLGRLDSKENILANKLTALIGREEPKDLADIWGFCCQLGMPIQPAIEGEQSKAAGIFPPDLARVLHSVTAADWEVIRWHNGPDTENFVSDLKHLAESLLISP